MFMDRIDLATATPVKPRSKALKLAAGLVVTLLCAALMVPWTLLVAGWAAAGLIAAAARGAYRTLLYAGEAVVGR